MPVTTYDPRKVAVQFRGRVLTGFFDGTFITVTRDEDSFSKHTGADGDVSRAANANKGGKVTLTLKQTSASNDTLTQIHEQDETLNDGVGILSIVDASGRTIVAVPEAWILKPADVEFAKEIVAREWTFDCAKFSPKVAGN